MNFLGEPALFDRRRKFTYSEDQVRLILGWLGRPRGIIAEFGSGTGFLTRILARARPSQIVAIDLDIKMLLFARKKFTQQIRDLIDIVQADVRFAPFRDDAADMTICHSLLCNLSHPGEAVKEMVRATRDWVASIEPCGLYDAYDPWPSLNDLLRKSIVANIESRRRKGIDFGVGLKIPHLFLKSGLSHLRANGLLSVWLMCDERFDSNDILSFLDKELALEGLHFKSEEKRRLAGGMSRKDVTRFRKLRIQRVTKFERNSSLVKLTPQTSYFPRLVITGRKNRSKR